MVIPCTSELCNYISYQVEMVARPTNQFIGSITTVARHVVNCFVMWRPRDTISAIRAHHQPRV